MWLQDHGEKNPPLHEDACTLTCLNKAVLDIKNISIEFSYIFLYVKLNI